MTPRLSLSLLLVMALAAGCAPAQVAAPTAETLAASPVPTETVVLQPTSTPIPLMVTDTPSPLPVATSRGPNLEATDPQTVALASGGLQLVEFFRFT